MSNKFVKISKQLYPTGRAFRIAEGSELEKLHEALAESESRLDSDSLSILDSVLPDNDNFTELDAELWEGRLGLITNPDVSLEDRKLAIIRKMNHPGDIPARQSWDYLQDRLRSAGFDVYVHENLDLVAPSELVGSDVTGVAVHSSNVEHAATGVYHGGSDSGSVFNNCIANSIYEEKDAFFDIGSNLRSTFYIGGENLGDFATVSGSRKLEFRQLILRIKPVQAVGFLFINYD
jgi:hypothetical protein